jgi:hypothetical protein
MYPKDAPNATPQDILQEVLDVLTALSSGHFTAYMTDNMPGIGAEIAKVLNGHLAMLQHFRGEHHRLMEEVGVTGRLGGQMEVAGVAGSWKEMFDDVNRMGAHITSQFRDGGNIVRALVRGDLAARITCRNIQGEFREFREHFNQLADQFEQRSNASVEPAGV